MTSISAERASLAKVGMTLRRREQWGARRSYTDARNVNEPATKQFIHITVTNPNAYRSHDAHARAIEAIGIARFSNTGISYNRLLMAGTRNVYEAQPIGRRGAHTVNDFRRSRCSTSGCPSQGTSLAAPSWNLNYNARAYAYASNVGFSMPDHVVDDLARVLAADRLAGFVTRDASIHGHRCVSAKSCPGDRVWERMDDVERRVQHYLDNGLNGDDDMSPRDWDSKDREAVRDIVESALRFPTIVTAPNDESWNIVHVLSWLMSQSAAQRDALARVLANQQAIMAAQGVEVDEQALAAQIAAVLVPAVVAEVSDATSDELEATIGRVLERLRVTVES